MDRRRFLGWCAGAAAAAAVGTGCGAPPAPARRAARRPAPALPPGPVDVAGAPLRPPAVPLATRDPYTSAWLCDTDLTGGWAQGWDGPPMQVCGLARVDGQALVWCGRPDLAGVPAMRQVKLQVTSTRTVFTFEDAGVRLEAEWLSPVEPGNPTLQSVPLALLTVTVTSTDGRRHDVQLYCEISGQWVSWDDTDVISWGTSQTANRHWAAQLVSPSPLSEHNDMAAWGSVVFSTTPAGSTYQAGAAATLREQFAARGALTGDVDPHFRAIDDAAPAFGLAHDLGAVGPRPADARWSMGHVLDAPAVRYLGQPLDPLWTRHWSSWSDMADAFLAGAPAARRRAVALDDRIARAAAAAGGPGYAALCALAVRQAYAACYLVAGPDGQPWAFLEEISSDEDISTVDIILASSAVWLYLDPRYLAMLLEPVLSYAASDRWTEPYAPHSLGFWPLADGNPPGAASEPMPIQESAGMLVMIAALAARDGSGALPLVERYSDLWPRWAALVAAQLPEPPSQLATVDYLGPSAGNTNLACLGVVGLGAAAQLATLLRRHDEAREWSAQATRFAGEWAAAATDADGRHLDAEEGAGGSWSILCNAFWDRA
ncbi:MAG TPA: DUF5127 domain-containing protein, partial [Acidimicrobiales bacterium]|nr:DUF5127 domain-containing protein [Acidimicrobiales bacterium]